MTKTCIAVSDTHCIDLRQLLKGKEADILIHAGDALTAGTVQEWHKFVRFLEHLSGWFGTIIYVPGNHDIFVERNLSLCEQQLKDLGMHMLVDRQAIIHGIKFYGSPWVPHISGRWAWEMAPLYKDGDLQAERVWCKIPTSTEVLITHTPPAEILAERWGCPSLADHVLQRIKPRYHIFGHIHERHGTCWLNGTKFYNVSIMDERYDPKNKPTSIEIEEN